MNAIIKFLKNIFSGNDNKKGQTTNDGQDHKKTPSILNKGLLQLQPPQSRALSIYSRKGYFLTYGLGGVLWIPPVRTRRPVGHVRPDSRHFL